MRRDEAGAQTRWLPGDVQRTLSPLSLSSPWVLVETGWRSRHPPMDGEQMGPDSLHTNHCQGGFGRLYRPFHSDSDCLLKQEEGPGMREGTQK